MELPGYPQQEVRLILRRLRCRPVGEDLCYGVVGPIGVADGRRQTQSADSELHAAAYDETLARGPVCTLGYTVGVRVEGSVDHARRVAGLDKGLQKGNRNSVLE